jgi:hypothetical protein
VDRENEVLGMYPWVDDRIIANLYTDSNWEIEVLDKWNTRDGMWRREKVDRNSRYYLRRWKRYWNCGKG